MGNNSDEFAAQSAFDLKLDLEEVEFPAARKCDRLSELVPRDLSTFPFSGFRKWVRALRDLDPSHICSII